MSINSKALKDLGLACPIRDNIVILDRDILSETNHDTGTLRTFVEIHKPRLVPINNLTYDTIYATRCQ